MMKSRLLYPDVLRIMAIIGVVLIHVTAPVIGILDVIGEVRYWWAANIMNSAFRWSVPVFFMISGMFLLDPNRNESAKQFYFKRLARVLPAFVIWSFIYYLWGIRHELNRFETGSFIKGMAEGSLHYHLWFVYTIIALYIIVPLLRLFVKYASQGIIYACAACFIASNLSMVSGMLGWRLATEIPQITGYIGYFLLGYYLSITCLDLKRRRLLYGFGIASCLIIVLGNYWMIKYFPSLGSYFYNYISFPVLITAAALFVWFKQIGFNFVTAGTSRLLYLISSSVFSIYLSHVLVMEFLYGWHPWDIVNSNPWLYVFVVTALILMISFLLYLVWYGGLYMLRGISKLPGRLPKVQELIGQLKEIYDYREMLRNMVLKDLRTKYKGSVLGFLWTFLNPLLMLAIYSFVFSSIMKSDIPDFPMFILVALLPWNYFSQAILQGARSIVNNAELLKKVYFPREILPLSVIGSNLINYLLTLVILIPALWISGIHITTAVFSFPIVLFIQSMIIFPIVMLSSLGLPYLRDLEHILNVLMMICFYLTPVLFPVSFIPVEFRWIFDYNPMTPIINAYRDLFLYGQWPDFGALLPMLLVLIVLNTVIAVVFSVLQRNVVEEV
ncbi:ABC-type polysaccharide/polyol phosphate export permease/surface polysaccharide O-acyltransferase-like enzyme [Fontibacillus solani]|uniref:Transport permease protein n=1 Tax=Fontibacillus solani TaxID=1572857 RepID=A0A7W3STW3_9BACL|nr:acyltransferase family protein [Fontibacillus solani]MBA9086024.1 ABC-type polysaccharide/polyol phosphate export permease/surface polysaccharide O-acyltransferase-like enzyme [Fontibacillus solani]